MLPVASDHDIIEAVRGGDIERYAELIERYQRAAWKVAYGLVGNMADAEELSQNAWVKAYQALPRFRGEAKFSTWLYRIVVNECQDFRRRQARQPVIMRPSVGHGDEDPVLFDVEDPAAGPRDHAADRELAVSLSAAIRALPDRQREAFTLCQLHGLSLDDAAQVMGCRLGTIKAHLFRATEHLRHALAPWADVEVPR